MTNENENDNESAFEKHAEYKHSGLHREDKINKRVIMFVASLAAFLLLLGLGSKLWNWFGEQPKKIVVEKEKTLIKTQKPIQQDNFIQEDITNDVFLECPDCPQCPDSKQGALNSCHRVKQSQTALIKALKSDLSSLKIKVAKWKKEVTSVKSKTSGQSQLVANLKTEVKYLKTDLARVSDINNQLNIKLTRPQRSASCDYFKMWSKEFFKNKAYNESKKTWQFIFKRDGQTPPTCIKIDDSGRQYKVTCARGDMNRRNELIDQYKN